MKFLRSIAWLIIVSLSLALVTPAQHRRAPAPKTPAPTVIAPQQTGPSFENILAVDTYRVYCEIRGVGQLLKTQSFTEILDPILKVGSPPKEFQTLMKWLNTESDALTSSRMMVAFWPSRPTAPEVLLAIEFSSPEEAQKFEPRLNRVLPKVFPTPTPEPSPRPQDPAIQTKSSETDKGSTPPSDKPKEVLPNYVVKRAGSLIFISNAAFTSKALRPKGSKLLSEDANFRRVHDRFTTESVLVYFDTSAIEREEQERRKQMEAEWARREAETAKNEGDAPDEIPVTEPDKSAQPPPQVQEPANSPEPSPEPEVLSQPELQMGPPSIRIDPDTTPPPAPIPNPGLEALGNISGLFFGRTKWPNAIGLALSFEPDAYALRVLLAHEPGERLTAIPFIPQLASGPPIAPESPTVLPADAEFFVMLSVDYPQIYEGLVNSFTRMRRAALDDETSTATLESPFASYEQKVGLKVKDDLLPLLGNEIALSLPMKSLNLEPTPASPGKGKSDSASETKKPEEPSPVIAIAIRDREAVRAIIPRIIDSFGVKGASMLAQTEKRSDTEIVNYANALAYAFIGNFLVVSPDPKAVRHVVDAYLSHATLGSDSHFRNYTRWQPRQVLGQLYVSPALMESYSAFAQSLDVSTVPSQLADLLARLSPTSEPVTYALSDEGSGPLHELRIPKNLALLMIVGIFGVSSLPAEASNEMAALSALRVVSSAEGAYKETAGKGSYGTLDQLVNNGLVPKDLLDRNGYKIEVRVSGTSFEAIAVPNEYGKTGKRSFFVDESGVVRGGDHGGGPATVADKPVS